MNIVYLIGNGFDRNLNLSTDYKSFYNYYSTQPSNSEEIKSLKKEIISDYKNWSDLEEALGKYFEHISNENIAKEIHKDLLDNLQKYILEQDKKFKPTKSYIQPFLKELFYPLDSLRNNQKKSLYDGLLRGEQEKNLYIISFNYTETIERLLNYENTPILYTKYRGYEHILKEIEHIHGFCNPQKGRMALGLDNENQIHNPILAKSRIVSNRFIKPTYNSLYGVDHHSKCLNWIKGASFICIFGMSIGVSDQTWWHAIGTKLKNSNSVLLYFYYDGFELNNNNAPDFQEQIDYLKDNLLPKLGIDDINNQDIRNRIYISCSKKMFKYNE